jgi:hypothetical protein
LSQIIYESKSVRVAKIGVFAALYVATSFVPISMFIGAPSFLSLSLIITPVIAIIFSPIDALLTSLFGGVLSFYAVPSQAMFGPYSILLPMCGATFGSLAYHKGKLGALATSFFLLGSISAYLVINLPFPFFVVPHSFAIILAIVSFTNGMTPAKVKIPIFVFIATMSEQGMMMILAVHLLNLPWSVFVGILPLMIYERLIATLGATLIVFALTKSGLVNLPHYSRELPKEVIKPVKE